MYINICLYDTSSSLMFTIIFSLLFPLFPRLNQPFTREIKDNSIPPSNPMPPWLVDGRSPCFFFPRRTEQAQDQSRNVNSSPLGVEVHFLISVSYSFKPPFTVSVSKLRGSSDPNTTALHSQVPHPEQDPLPAPTLPNRQVPRTVPSQRSAATP